jgi:hypothetical protein
MRPESLPVPVSRFDTLSPLTLYWDRHLARKMTETQFVGEIRIILLVVLLPEIRIFRRLANPDNGIDFSRHPSWDVHRAASANVPRQEPST